MVPEMFDEPIADHAPTEVPTNSVEDRRRSVFLPVRLWEDLTGVAVCWGKVSMEVFQFLFSSLCSLENYPKNMEVWFRFDFC